MLLIPGVTLGSGLAMVSIVDTDYLICGAESLVGETAISKESEIYNDSSAGRQGNWLPWGFSSPRS